MPIKSLATLLCLLPALASAAPDDDTIDAGRPDFVESSNVVGKGRFQVEAGLTATRDRVGNYLDRDHATPITLRYGLGDTLELQAESDGRLRASERDLTSGVRQSQQGYSDLSLGLKWHIADAAGSRPSLGVLALVTLDTGSPAFRATGPAESLRLTAEWDLPNEFGLSVMPGIASQRNDEGQRYTSGILGVVLDKSWTERFRTFVGYSAQQIARARDGGSVLTFDTGAAWLLTKAVQLDTAVSRGLNKTTPDWSWTAGVSFKY